MAETKYLSNGVRLVSEQIPHVRSVSLGLWIDAGSRQERAEENGMAHFIEHMLFKGTSQRSAADIAGYFDRIGGEMEAFTAKDTTCLQATVLDEHAEQTAEVFADMFFHSRFDPEDVEKERNVILEEISMVEDTPDDIIHDMLWQASYGTHPLARPILGTREVLREITRERLLDFFHDHYTPERIVISAAGHVSEELLACLERLFAGWGHGRRAENREERAVFVPGREVKHRETEQAHLCLGFPGVSRFHDHYFAEVLWNNLLGGSMSSRLFQEVREDRGLAYSIFSSFEAFECTGFHTIYSAAAPERVGELLETIDGLFERLSAGNIKEVEIDNHRSQLKSAFVLGLESSAARMARNARNEMLFGRHPGIDETLDRLGSVQLDHVVERGLVMMQTPPSASLIQPNGHVPELLKKNSSNFSVSIEE